MIYCCKAVPNRTHREGLELGNRYSCKHLRNSPKRGLLRRGFLSGSLAIGSGSSAPPVDTRRREGKLPASVVSTPFPARFCVMGPSISASIPPPPELPNTASNPTTSPGSFPRFGRQLSHSGPHCPAAQLTSRAQGRTPKWQIMSGFVRLESLVLTPALESFAPFMKAQVHIHTTVRFQDEG